MKISSKKIVKLLLTIAALLIAGYVAYQLYTYFIAYSAMKTMQSMSDRLTN